MAKLLFLLMELMAERTVDCTAAATDYEQPGSIQTRKRAR
jgi:hypothetical protein